MPNKNHSRFRHPLLALLACAGPLGSPLPASAAEDCDASRRALGNQIQEARLGGDGVRLSALEEQLAALNTRCRGLVPLQSNHDAVEAASRRVSAEEAALRAALGQGDTLAIGASQRRLDEARRGLEAARRGEAAASQ
ncbi:DUF1090 family protein [Stutzerimonas azotifigens]|uniref:DUF1090 family protein n=1 Tax=Stutzerimonas azotifigens TaxID=291995 RepID=UPI0006863187|nr:DUF1090 family protein [Stutzerimonas azotifigens]